MPEASPVPVPRADELEASGAQAAADEASRPLRSRTGETEEAKRPEAITEGDVEAQVDVDDGVKAGCGGRRRNLIYCSVCCGVMLACIATAMALLWPRDPSWEVRYLGFDKAALTNLIDAVTGKSNSTPPLDFHTSVGLRNPNFIGARAEASTFDISYGPLLLGTGQGEAADIGARSVSVVNASLVVNITPEIARLLSDDLLKAGGGFVLAVTVNGKAIADVAWLRIRCIMHCDVKANLLELLNKPDDIIAAQFCSYSYSI